MFEDTIPYKEYNKSNKDRARDLRNNMTNSEIIIWENILRKKQTGYIFLRQKMIGSFILDFYCSKLLLGIEID
jgi:very-short-patch-repair endonuclease